MAYSFGLTLKTLLKSPLLTIYYMHNKTHKKIIKKHKNINTKIRISKIKRLMNVIT